MRIPLRESGEGEGGGGTGSPRALGQGRMLSRPWLAAIDAAVACGYAFVFLSPSQTSNNYQGWWITFTLLTVVAPLPFRRFWPKSVFAVVLVGNAAALAMGTVRDPMLAAAFSLYQVAVGASPSRRGRSAWVVSTWVVLVFVAVVVGGVNLSSSAVRTTLVSGVTLGGAWILGRAVDGQRVQTDRAVRESALRAAVEERLHLARELHDVVSGTLNVILVQASVGNHMARQRPEQSAEALESIESVSREGIAEMGRMLDVLTGEAAGPNGLHAASGPLPDRLDRAAERARAAGVDVSFASESAPDGLSPEVDLVVHRVVQEALTNVIRHAAPTQCRVRVAADRDRVHVEIVDTGPPGSTAGAAPDAPRSPRTGRGLSAMRDRVTDLGGTLIADPVPGGGFRVEATVPVHPPQGSASPGPAELGP